MKIGEDYIIVDDETAPKGRRIVKIEAIEPELTEVEKQPTRRGRPPKNKG